MLQRHQSSHARVGDLTRQHKKDASAREREREKERELSISTISDTSRVTKLLTLMPSESKSEQDQESESESDRESDRERERERESAVGDTGSIPVSSDSKRSTSGRKKWPVSLELPADGGVSLYSPLPQPAQSAAIVPPETSTRTITISPVLQRIAASLSPPRAPRDLLPVAGSSEQILMISPFSKIQAPSGQGSSTTPSPEQRGRRRCLMASPTNADPDDPLSLSLYWPIRRRSSPAEFLEGEEADALEGAGDLEAPATAHKKRTVASQRSIASAKSASSVCVVPQESASRGGAVAGGRPNVGSWHGTAGADDSQELAGAVTSVATSPAVNRTLFDAFELFLRSQVYLCRCLCLCLLRLCRSVHVSVSTHTSPVSCVTFVTLGQYSKYQAKPQF